MAGILDTLRTLFAPPAERGLTYQQVWNTGADWSPVNSTTGLAVNTETALRSIAVQSAIRLLTNDVASLPVDAFRNVSLPSPSDPDGNIASKKELRRPPWVVEPNPNNPNATWEDHIKQVVFSMLTDGNAFTYCFPSVFDVQAMRTLEPRSVEIRGQQGFGEVIYHVADIGELTPANIVHIPWVVPPGKNRGMNPIESAKQGLGIALAIDEFVGAYFGNGAVLSGVIEFPEGVEPTEEQVNALKRDFQRRHVGVRKSHAVGALTGGASFKPLPYSNHDAQLIELRQEVIEDVARLFGIPPHMLGSQRPGAVAFASIEQRSIDYVTHAILPIVRRIEVGYGRLLRGQKTYLKFNVSGLLRADHKTRWDAYAQGLQNKVIRREEVRALEDLPFDGDGVGYLETPNNNAPGSALARSQPVVADTATSRALVEWEEEDVRPEEVRAIMREELAVWTRSGTPSIRGQ